MSATLLLRCKVDALLASRTTTAWFKITLVVGIDSAAHAFNSVTIADDGIRTGKTKQNQKRKKRKKERKKGKMV